MLKCILNSIQAKSILSALIVTASYGRIPPYTAKQILGTITHGIHTGT